MKDLITTIAAIAIMLVFVLQFSMNQVIISRTLASDRAVDNYRLRLSEKGGFDDAERLELIENIAHILGCNQSEVIVEEGEDSYEVRAPIKNVIACADFLGIAQDENKVDYVASGDIS